MHEEKDTEINLKIIILAYMRLPVKFMLTLENNVLSYRASNKKLFFEVAHFLASLD